MLELDGSCGPLSVKRKRIASAFFSKDHATPGPYSTRTTLDNDSKSGAPTDFVSQSTQTCICGLLELQFMWYLSGRCKWPSQDSSSIRSENTNDCDDVSTSTQMAPSTSCTTAQVNSNPSVSTSTMSLGGPLAFHPFPVSSQSQDLNRIVTASEWTRFMTRSAPFTVLSNHTRSFIKVDPSDCPGCVSDQLQTSGTTEPVSLYLLGKRGLVNLAVSKPVFVIESYRHKYCAPSHLLC